MEKPFRNLLNQAKVSKKLNISKRQAVIKLLEKNDKNKGLISNYGPLSLFNVDKKTILGISASRLKKVIPNFISSQQTTYVAQRRIIESERLICNFLSVNKRELQRLFTNN